MSAASHGMLPMAGADNGEQQGPPMCCEDDLYDPQLDQSNEEVMRAAIGTTFDLKRKGQIGYVD